MFQDTKFTKCIFDSVRERRSAVPLAEGHEERNAAKSLEILTTESIKSPEKVIEIEQVNGRKLKFKNQEQVEVLGTKIDRKANAIISFLLIHSF